MLHEFLTSNRIALIRRCREKVAKRMEPAAIPDTVDHGVPLFLQQLIATLKQKQVAPAGSGTGPAAVPAEIGESAALHGTELLRLGYNVDQVVRDYGDVCQAVTELAVEQHATITPDEFRTLNSCLDDAIADAVTAFGHAHHVSVSGRAEDLHNRLGAYSDEQRRLVDIAIRAYSAIRTGSIGLTGATGNLLTHTLTELRSLAERTLPELQAASATAATAPAT